MLSLIADTIWLLCVVVFSVAEAVLYTLYPKPKKSIRGETAVVTGAGHGIGREYALQLARLGARVVCWDINPTTCEKTKYCTALYKRAALKSVSQRGRVSFA